MTKEEKDRIIKGILAGNISFKELSVEYRKDKEIVKEAIRQKPATLRYAHRSIKNDKSVIRFAVNEDGRTFMFASNKLKHDREFIKDIVNIAGIALRHTAP